MANRTDGLPQSDAHLQTAVSATIHQNMSDSLAFLLSEEFSVTSLYYFSYEKGTAKLRFLFYLKYLLPKKMLHNNTSNQQFSSLLLYCLHSLTTPRCFFHIVLKQCHNYHKPMAHHQENSKIHNK